ncbi:MAG: biotin-dependent carboxyltransferase family protein [Nitrospiraceae bacterium]
MSNLEPARIHVVRPGLLSTVQDLGRYGFQRYGMPVAGAMDTVALRLGNRLVGNPDHLAVLEMTMQGAELAFETEATIALTGADLSPHINGEPAQNWTALGIAAGSILTFGARRTGARAYLALSGGIHVQPVLGSCSTHVRSRTGGHLGRTLAKDDFVHGHVPPSNARNCVGRSVPSKVRPSYQSEPTLRAVPGPQDDGFLPDAMHILTSNEYILSLQSDRMGYRLVGPPLLHKGAAEIISEATPAGAVQVPPNQQPILLMADRQTTGGYPKIAVVISADLPLAAQLVPGDRIGFAVVDFEEARALLREVDARMNATIAPVRL